MTGTDLLRFVHATRPLRVVFAPGAAWGLGDELDRLAVEQALLITTPRAEAEAADLLPGLGDRLAGVYSGARLHVPASVVREAVDAARRVKADGLVTLGGGSPIGVAKAVALETGLPIVAVPTTYSGSEMTAVWGTTEEGGKKTGKDDRVAPRVVVYDPKRTLTLPPEMSAASGMNAVAHAVEALYAHDRSPLSDLLAEAAIRDLAVALPQVVRDPGGLAGRTRALRGAHLAGWSLDLASMGLHHKLAHVLGGTFDLPHALVHAVLLPHTATFNEPEAPEAMERVARALGAERAPAGLFELNRRLGITTTLAELGLEPAHLDRVADLALQEGYPNPRPLTREGVRGILEDAWAGTSPK